LSGPDSAGSLLGIALSAAHEPAGYNSHQGCVTIPVVVLLIAIVMGLVKGCR
jgi:hypothetical protein